MAAAYRVSRACVNVSKKHILWSAQLFQYSHLSAMGIPDVVSETEDSGAVQESRAPATNTDPHELFYRVEDVPEWPKTILLGFQVHICFHS